MILQANFLSRHSLSDLLSDHGNCPFRNKDMRTRPWKMNNQNIDINSFQIFVDSWVLYDELNNDEKSEKV